MASTNDQISERMAGSALPIAQDVATASSTEQKTESTTDSQKKEVPIENRLAEMNRRMTKFETSITSKLDQLIKTAPATQTAWPTASPPVANTVDAYIDQDTKRYIDSMFQNVKKEQIQIHQNESFTQAKRLYPELDEGHEEHDATFLKVANEFFAHQSQTNHPDAPLWAVELAAKKLGKTEKQAKEAVFKDEQLRTRKLQQGSIEPRGTTSQPEANEKLVQLAKAFPGLDQSKVAKYLKENAKKYGLEE